ncbi:unnamed protein product [Prorocentrum cordatum]|uniref:Uncharacterized protein n=1 Tax=Prorocentrum cordatum TaxID=2364126 RepID=A0ABN9PTP2_9DINO|nr:unnamed protein product [Polarella glacialis]|eukprot:9472949-Pyramimonas_sp.AAC.1
MAPKKSAAPAPLWPRIRLPNYITNCQDAPLRKKMLNMAKDLYRARLEATMYKARVKALRTSMRTVGSGAQQALDSDTVRADTNEEKSLELKGAVIMDAD